MDDINSIEQEKSAFSNRSDDNKNDEANNKEKRKKFSSLKMFGSFYKDLLFNTSPRMNLTQFLKENAGLVDIKTPLISKKLPLQQLIRLNVESFKSIKTSPLNLVDKAISRHSETAFLRRSLEEMNLYPIEISEKDNLSLWLPNEERTKAATLEIILNKDRFLLGPGLHIVMAPAESGKSTLIRKVFDQKKTQAVLFNERFYEDNNIVWPFIKTKTTATDLIALEDFISYCFISELIPIIDSFRIFLDINDKRTMTGGIPAGPFQFLNRLSCALVDLKQAMIVTLPVIVTNKEQVQVYFDAANQSVESVFWPDIAEDRLTVSIRNCWLRKQRVPKHIRALREATQEVIYE